MIDQADAETPSLQIAGLRVWVHSRAFPEAQDHWDGNWLRVTAKCTYGASSVEAGGVIIHLRELARLLEECERLYESLSGVARLECLEPNLGVTLTAKTGGKIGISIRITPDQLMERHEFEDAFDQTYLPAIIEQCRQILSSYPLRDEGAVR